MLKKKGEGGVSYTINSLPNYQINVQKKGEGGVSYTINSLPNYQINVQKKGDGGVSYKRFLQSARCIQLPGKLKKKERGEFHTQLIHYLLFLYIDWTYKREFKKNIPAKILFEV